MSAWCAYNEIIKAWNGKNIYFYLKNVEYTEHLHKMQDVYTLRKKPLCFSIATLNTDRFSEFFQRNI